MNWGIVIEKSVNFLLESWVFIYYRAVSIYFLLSSSGILLMCLITIYWLKSYLSSLGVFGISICELFLFSFYKIPLSKWLANISHTLVTSLGSLLKIFLAIFWRWLKKWLVLEFMLFIDLVINVSAFSLNYDFKSPSM